MTTTLPRRGAVEQFAPLRALLDKQGFLDALPGTAVLVRLDERGGRDDPAPWAFHGSGVPRAVDPRGKAAPATKANDAIDDAADPTKTGRIDASTLTGPGFALSIPPARGRATVHVIPRGSTASIGRDRQCAIVVNERSISRRHAELVERDARVHLCEAGATNGVAVNGTRLLAGDQAVLSTGDIIELGDVALMFLSAADFWESLPRLMGG